MVYTIIGKRLTDIFLSLTLLSLLIPLIAWVCLVLALVTGKWPLFVQKRPGKNFKIFKLYKIRTMYGNTNPFLARFCFFLRRHSIDEFPQLFNVLSGDMALVGPRPLLAEYIPLYNNFQKKRHQISPGITGLAQIRGRNAISWEKKFELDVWYTHHVSFLLDCEILSRSLGAICFPRHVKEKGLQEHEKFKGSQPLLNARL